MAWLELRMGTKKGVSGFFAANMNGVNLLGTSQHDIGIDLNSGQSELRQTRPNAIVRSL